MQKEILNFCLKNGLLVDDEVVNLFSDTSDLESVKIIIEKIKNKTHQRVITKSTLEQNKDEVGRFISNLPVESQKSLENIKIKLGLSIEISKESVGFIKKPVEYEIVGGVNKVETKKINNKVKVVESPYLQDKKLEVKDFVTYFRNRFNEFRSAFLEHEGLKNLVSLNKIGNSRNNVCVIGLVSKKNITKNGNFLFDIEDLTGTARVLIKADKKELAEKAEEIALDSVVAFSVSGNNEILFANDVFFLDSALPERKNSILDENAVFIADLHACSVNFMEENFLKFIDYLNGGVEGTEDEISKIKYLFVVGDIVAGVGNYPNQEEDLKIKDLEEQFIYVANLFKKIRKDIQIIICPGNHDGVRIMEPQPMFDEKFAWPLYEMENVTLVPNPSDVNIGACEGFEGFNVLLYHGFSFFYYADNITSLIKEKAAHSPELIIKYLLKNRHLAPAHGSNQYFPGEKDTHFIKNIPDIFVTGHVHKSAIGYYNNILYISCSGWEKMTDYMEKRGAEPDFCKVPLFNLKTRAVKILDFE